MDQKGLFRGAAMLVGASALAASAHAALERRSAALSNRIFGFDNIRDYLRRQKRDHARGANNSIAQRNRWTGNPHEHRREIARNLRRAERQR